MKLLSLIIMAHNWISDKDFIWWPFSFLKPEPSEEIDMGRVLQMTLCFGGLAFTMYTFFAVANGAFTISSAFSTIMGCFGGFFIWFTFVTKPFWNHRAFALQKMK